MGQNLAHLVWPDTSKDVVGPGDQDTLRRLAALWGGSFYVFFMIWAMTLLVDRWRGPRGTREVGFASVVAAGVLSTAWPVVMVYFILNPE